MFRSIIGNENNLQELKKNFKEYVKQNNILLIFYSNIITYHCVTYQNVVNRKTKIPYCKVLKY